MGPRNLKLAGSKYCRRKTFKRQTVLSTVKSIVCLRFKYRQLNSSVRKKCGMLNKPESGSLLFHLIYPFVLLQSRSHPFEERHSNFNCSSYWPF
jgi:hypothetical protein